MLGTVRTSSNEPGMSLERWSFPMLAAPPHLDYKTWKDQIQKIGGRFDPKGDPKKFIGWARPLSVCGLTAVEVGSNAPRVERISHDIRLDGADHYVALFQLDGHSAMTHNEEAVRFGVGDVVLVDMARPATFFNFANGCQRWNTMALFLPRRPLVSHLGFEPRGGLCRRSGTAVVRVLLDLIRNSGEEASPPSPTDCYVRLAVHDLVGAVFAPGDPAPARHADKLFMRVRAAVKDGFADPDFGPCDVAERVGISLRYLQKLFTQRRSTCHEFIYSIRLDYAAHLLQRQAALGANQALGEIAYASGFRDHSHFAKRFRQRFGHAPGAHVEEESCNREGALNVWG
jgi:AraC-like DNA-binding protein